MTSPKKDTDMTITDTTTVEDAATIGDTNIDTANAPSVRPLPRAPRHESRSTDSCRRSGSSSEPCDPT